MGRDGLGALIKGANFPTLGNFIFSICLQEMCWKTSLGGYEAMVTLENVWMKCLFPWCSTNDPEVPSTKNKSCRELGMVVPVLQGEMY